MRTGADYLSSLNDGRRVFLDGEAVEDVVRASGVPAKPRARSPASTTSPPIRATASA